MINDYKMMITLILKQDGNEGVCFTLMPCLFLGIHFSGNHFLHFPMFGKHKESWSRKLNSGQRKKYALCQESVFLSLF